MTAPVDVRAVNRAARRQIADGPASEAAWRLGQDLDAAHAAVAELMAQNRLLQSCLQRAIEAAEPRMPNATFLYDSRAALARCSGGAS